MARIEEQLESKMATEPPHCRRVQLGSKRGVKLLWHICPVTDMTYGVQLLDHYGSPKILIINPRRACAARVTVLGPFVCLSVCLLPRFLPPRATRQRNRDIKGSALHRLDFKFGDFRKSNAFESYGVKTK